GPHPGYGRCRYALARLAAAGLGSAGNIWLAALVRPAGGAARRRADSALHRLLFPGADRPGCHPARLGLPLRPAARLAGFPVLAGPATRRGFAPGCNVSRPGRHPRRSVWELLGWLLPLASWLALLAVAQFATGPVTPSGDRLLDAALAIL